MRRREFIAGLGAAAWPVVAGAQQAMPVVGFIGTETPEHFQERVRGFRQGLTELGFIEGANLKIDYRWAEGRYDRLASLAEELVRRPVAVLHTGANGPAALAAKSATSTIPIVFVTGINPVEAGLVVSLNRPGGNITGVTSLNVELTAKRLQIASELLPSAKQIGFLVNPSSEYATTVQTSAVQDAARSIGIDPLVVAASTQDELERVFDHLHSRSISLLLVAADAFFTSRARRLAELALSRRIAAIYHSREFASAGGIISYGGSFAEFHRLAGNYVGRILKGESPAALPVQQSAKVELTVNLRTAKALGLQVPLSLLGRADEVIE